MSNINGRTIVYFSSIPWNFSWHRQQEMMSMLADMGHMIIFVQPQNKRKWIGAQPYKLRDNIWVISPPGFPFERCCRAINFTNGALSQICVSYILKQLKVTNPIIWFDRVHGCFAQKYLKRHSCVYDLIDDTLVFGRFRNVSMLRGIENEVIKKSKIVFSSSRSLLERKLIQGGYRENTFFIPNGIDIRRFTLRKKNAAALNLKIGFVGEISKRRINYSLVKECARKRPNWVFEFIGPGVHAEKEELSEENIIVRHGVPGRDIPNILLQFDIGFIPYRHKCWDMDYVFPRKALEFLAVGIPVVSTPMKELHFMEPYVRCGETADEIIAEIENASQSVLPEKNRNFAEKYDWNHLLSKCSLLISKL